MHRRNRSVKAQSSKKYDDCYFFFYGTCVKDIDCEYRHSPDALGSEKVCKEWMLQSCKVVSCPFRHMKPHKIKRSHIDCYYENKPSGCRKPHCMFRHRTDRKYILDDIKTAPQSLILPVEIKESAKKPSDDAIILLTQKLMAVNMKNGSVPGSGAPQHHQSGREKVADVLRMSRDKRKCAPSTNRSSSCYATGSPLQMLPGTSRFRYTSAAYEARIRK